MKLLTLEQLAEVMHAEKYREKREQYMTRMAAEGYEIYMPDDNEVLLDIDSEDDYNLFLARFDRMSIELIETGGFVTAPIFKVYPSKSGLPHRHVIVEFPREIENDYERLLIQALLCSDPVRELLSLFRIWHGDPCPTLLAMLKGSGD